MLTRSRSQRGEGTLEEFYLETRKRRVAHILTMNGSDAGETPEAKMSEENFQRAFFIMQQMLGELYKDK